jgi:transposase InsO family protein
MRACGLQGVHRRGGFRTTRRDATAAPAPDLVQRDFGATEPDRTWVADITYVPTWSGFRRGQANPIFGVLDRDIGARGQDRFSSSMGNPRLHKI